MRRSWAGKGLDVPAGADEADNGDNTAGTYVVQYTDRDRPHLIFDQDGVTPLAPAPTTGAMKAF
jgi:hypothetical protein